MSDCKNLKTIVILTKYGWYLMPYMPKDIDVKPKKLTSMRGITAENMEH